MNEKEIIQNHNSLTLAYIGDAVFELYVREYLLGMPQKHKSSYQKMAAKFVSSAAQSELLTKLLPFLTESELGVVRRGKNTKPHSKPKNADIALYHNATGFEALWGYLYLLGDHKRLQSIFDIITAKGE